MHTSHCSQRPHTNMAAGAGAERVARGVEARGAGSEGALATEEGWAAGLVVVGSAASTGPGKGTSSCKMRGTTMSCRHPLLDTPR